MTDALRDLSEPEHLSIHDPILRHTFSVESDEDHFSTLFDLLTPPEWHRHAACKGKTDLFFSDDHGRTAQKTNKDAKKICATCPVRVECAKSAVDNHERHGIWGGLTRDDRKELRIAFPRNAWTEVAPDEWKGTVDQLRAQRLYELRARHREEGWCWACVKCEHKKCSGGCTCPRCREEGAA